MEALHLLRDWEKFQIRDCNYRNHRIFTLRCISKGIIPVSIRLKTSIQTEKARKIIRKAERDLLQARVKSINCLLGYNAKQRDLWRSKLVSIIFQHFYEKCQELIDKVSEFRHFKVKQRQINKCNRLIQKEENITWSGTPDAQAGSTLPPAARVSYPQAGSTSPQATTLSSPQTGSSYSQAVRSNLTQASSAGSQPGRTIGSTGTQSQADSASSQAASVSLPRQVALPRQIVLVLPRQVALLSKAVRANLLQASSTGPQAGRNAGHCRHSILGWAALLPRHLVLVLPRQVAFFPKQWGSVCPRQTPQAPLCLQGIFPPKGENALEDPKLKSVINLSSKPLTQAQRSLLAKGPNYVITPRHPPYQE